MTVTVVSLDLEIVEENAGYYLGDDFSEVRLTGMSSPYG